jgi:hypothetical protein
MPIVPSPAFRRAALLALGLSFGGALVACGGGNDGQADAPVPPVAEIDTAPLVLTDEQRDDGSYALYRVDVHTGARVLLDQ